MRDKMAPLEEARSTFYATFSRYGWKPGYATHEPIRTLLLVNVKRGQREVADHLWFTVTKGFAKLGELHPGDVVSFDARVKTYLKGYGSWEEKEQDFKLSFPTRIRLIKKGEKEIENDRNENV